MVSGGEVVITIKMVTDISWFDAIKLRLAGGRTIQNLIEKQITPKVEKEVNDKLKKGEI